MKKIDWNALFRKDYKDWPDRALISKAKGLHHAIFVCECSGPHDLWIYDAILAELERRGFEQVTELEFTKEGKVA